MKTRAWDGKQWRTDYVLAPNGDMYDYFSTWGGFVISNKVNWKLSRFTGMCTKKSEEVYEGDVVQVEEWRAKPDDEGKHWKWYEYVVTYKDQRWEPDGLEGARIVGNIFQNPELLEV